MKAAVIIPCFNRRDTTLACLARLRDLGVAKWATLVVVDDGSTDGTAAAIRESFPETTVLMGDGSLWWGGAVQLGMTWALDHDAEFVFWLNDDAFPRPGALETLLRTSADCGAITTANGILMETGSHHYGGWLKTSHTTRLIPCPPGTTLACATTSGNCVCLPAEAILRTGGIDPAFPHIHADADFGLRASALGIPMLTVGDALYDCTYGQSANRQSWLLGDASLQDLWRTCFHPQAGALSWCGLRFKARHWGWRGITHHLASLLRLIAVSLLRCLIPHSWRRAVFGKNHAVQRRMNAVRKWQETHA